LQIKLHTHDRTLDHAIILGSHTLCRQLLAVAGPNSFNACTTHNAGSAAATAAATPEAVADDDDDADADADDVALGM
jgi:hypothetical protein